MKLMTKTLIVANRLPITMEKNRCVLSDGGLVRALGHFMHSDRSVWFGYGDRSIRDGGIDYKAVTIPKAIYQSYYANFANRVLWLALHGMKPFIEGVNDWPNYVRANELFAEAIAAELDDDDDLIWIQDYHLFMLPVLLRERQITNRVGFFLHIPFPPFDDLSNVPNYERIIASLLTVDLLGFQTEGDVTIFLSCLEELGYDIESDWQGTKINGRRIGLQAFPVTIDAATFALPDLSGATAFYEQMGPHNAGQKGLFALSRLDYTKGILELLGAMELLLEDPNWRHVLRLAVIPSRLEVPEYNQLKLEIEALVAKINDFYGHDDFTPIDYSYAKIPLDELTLMYKTADVMVVNSLADGMNVIAKEYVASRTDNRGVLVLSKFAGAADELDTALLIDPNNCVELTEGLRQAVDMSPAEQYRRMRSLRHQVNSTSTRNWGEGFLKVLSATSVGKD